MQPALVTPWLVAAASNQADPQQAAAELACVLNNPAIGWVVFFCSAEYPLPALADALNQHFSQQELVGCTTAGELTPAGYAQGSIVALGFLQPFFRLSTALIQPLDAFDLPAARQLVGDLLAGVDQPRCFVMTLLDGLSSQEELVLAALDTALGGIPHFGGSAGDDIQLTHTHVFHQGRFYSEAAVTLVFETALAFEVFSTHHVLPLATKLVVTAADAATRRVYELNAEPAAEVYARLLGLTPAALTPTLFALNPLAARLGQDHYVRSIQQVNADGSLTFYCAVGVGSVLTVMQPGALLPDLQQKLAEIEQRIGTPVLTLGCDCFLRRLEAEHLGQAQAASAFLRQHRVIGFNTYGEHHAGLHINQTFTGVVLGQGSRHEG